MKIEADDNIDPFNPRGINKIWEDRNPMMKNCKFVRIGFCLLGLMAILMPTGLALATSSEGGFEQEVDGYHVQLVFEGHPKTGSNEVGVRITDPGGNPLLGAVVEVSLGPAAEGHQEMEAEGMAEDHGEMEAEVHEETGGHSESKSVLLTATGEEGLYSGEISFSEPGDWFVSVRILLEDEMVEKELSFPVDVVASGPPWVVLSGFFGINLIVVAVAGFLKRKPLAAKS